MTSPNLNVDQIRTVAVLGGGTMGNGIAHVFARSGYSVILRDVEKRFLDHAPGTISKNLDREIKKGQVAQADKPQILGRIESVTDLAALTRADFAIEAVPETIEIKREVLAAADRVLRPAAILATNTSSISVTALAGITRRPDRFLGMHFMNPVPVMVLVEVIRALQTSEATFETAMKLCEKIGKKPVAVNDSPGFVSNRVLMPLINEAAFCVMEGVATPESVDAVMKLGMNHPMGPLELADYIGLDVCLDVLEVLLQGFGDPEIPRLPAVAQDGIRGLAGEEIGPRLLHLRTLRSAARQAATNYLLFIRLMHTMHRLEPVAPTKQNRELTI